MIRQSATIATLALVLSLLTHLFGLGVTFRAPTEQPGEQGASDSVELGQAFEDVAEPLTAPATPESAPAAPVEETIEPEQTSRALVASDTPIDTVKPDVGKALEVQPETVEPLDLTTSDTSEQKALEPTGSQERASPEPPLAQPTTSTAEATPPQDGAPAKPPAVEPVATAPLSPNAPTPPSETPQETVEVPDEVIAGLPATPVPVPSTVEVVPSVEDTLAPELDAVPIEPVPETPPTTAEDGDLGGSELAVRTSVRPQARAPRSDASPAVEGENTPELQAALGAALRSFQSGGVLPTGNAVSGSRTTGNASVTNYAGRALVHLNSTPRISSPARGTAVVSFEVKSDGSLAWVSVSRSTGSHEFDTLVRDQVRRAAPFPRPPKGANRRITFVFRAN